MERISDIDGFEELYSITESGLVIRKDFDRILKINFTTLYPSIQLCQNNRRHLRLIHRLLAIAFIPNPDNKPQVNHLNGNKRDYRLVNLEWATSSENICHAYQTGLSKVTDKCKQALSITHSGANHYNNKRVIDTVTGVVYDTIREAALINKIPVQTLHRHLHSDKNKTHLIFYSN